MRLIGFIVLVFSMTNTYAAHSSGRIKDLFVSDSGHIAVQLDSGFSEEAKKEHPSFNGWAGTTKENSALNAALLAAFTAGHMVNLCIDGGTGGWLKITCVYQSK